MSDLSEFTKFFGKMAISYTLQNISHNEAQEEARICNEPTMAKSAKYIHVGQSLFHFDFKGNFLGVEAGSFEPRSDLKEENKGDNTDSAAEVSGNRETDQGSD